MRNLMSWRQCHVSLVRRRGSAEKGAAAVIVTALLSFGVLLGFAALSIDVGSVMWERRQLQNGADAAAFALAGTCVESPALCSTTAPSTKSMLTGLNNANAADQLNAFDPTKYPAPANGLAGICGSGVAGITPCQPASTGLADCTALPPQLQKTPPVPYVEVHTLTQTKSGNLLPRWISQTIVGSAPGQGTRVAACARAAWGPAAPTNVTVLPVVVSYCDWANQTGYTPATGATYPSAPDYNQYPTASGGNPPGYGPNNPTPVTYERTVFTKTASKDPGTCQTWKNGSSAPGGFYSIADSTSSCSSNAVSAGGWVKAQPGNSLPCATFPDLRGQIVYIPVYDCLRPTGSGDPTDGLDCTGTSPKASGSNTYYHIAGYAAFYLTGGYFSSTPLPSVATGTVPCSNPERCMSGWFVKDLVPEGDIKAPDPNGPPNMGLNVVKAAG